MNFGWAGYSVMDKGKGMAASRTLRKRYTICLNSKKKKGKPTATEHTEAKRDRIEKTLIRLGRPGWEKGRNVVLIYDFLMRVKNWGSR